MRAIVGLVLMGLTAWAPPAAAECYGKGNTRTCIDQAGNVTITTETGDGTIEIDRAGKVAVQTELKNGSLSVSGNETSVQTHTGNMTVTTDQDGKTVTETSFDQGSVMVGSSPNGGNAWSQTTIQSGATVMTQTERNGDVVTEMEQAVGGGYVLRSVTDADGKTTNTTCGPAAGCQ